MRDIDIEYIKNFLYMQASRAIRPDDLWVAIGYMGFFSGIGLFTGVLMGGISLVIGILMTALTVIYIVATRILKHVLKASLKTDFLCNSIVSVSSVVIFVLLGLLCFTLQDHSILQWLALILTLPIPCVLFFFFMMRAIRRDAFNKKKRKKRRPNNAASVAVGASAIGAFLARILMPGLSQDIVLIIAYSICFLLAAIFSLGLLNILAYHYCTIYSIPDPYANTKTVWAKMTKSGKIALAIVCTVLGLAILLMLFPTIVKTFDLQPLFSR